MRAPAASLALVLASACATAPTHMYDLMDAEGDDAVESALAEAAEVLTDPGARMVTREAAARALGRLRRDPPVVIEALAFGLAAHQPPGLRRQAAWALGELRSPAGLPPLTAALRSPLDDETGAYVLEAVAKLYPVMARDEETLVTVVEAMVFYAGNRAGAPAALYDLLGARTRTVAVNVRVLGNALQTLAAANTAGNRAAVYNATLELLEKVASRRDEIRAGPAAWAGRVEAAMRAVRAAHDADPEAGLMVLWYLGQLAQEQELAGPAAEVLAGPDVADAARPTRAPRAAERLVAAWALARLQVHALGPRRALLLDLLSDELEPRVLRLLADLPSRGGEPDPVQRILGLTGGFGAAERSAP